MEPVPSVSGGKIVEADETYFGNVEPANVKTRASRGHAFTKKGKAANKRAA